MKRRQIPAEVILLTRSDAEKCARRIEVDELTSPLSRKEILLTALYLLATDNEGVIGTPVQVTDAAMPEATYVAAVAVDGNICELHLVRGSLALSLLG